MRIWREDAMPPLKSAKFKAEPVKPKLFLGFSSEEEFLAEYFIDALRDVATVVPWKDDEYLNTPMQSTLEALMEATIKYDYGLFLFTPDDLIKSRGKTARTTRDNVIFEFGLFLGKLGRERVFAVKRKDADPEKKVKDISDLAGYNIPGFTQTRDVDEMRQSVRTAVRGIRKLIQEQRRKRRRIPLANWYHFDSEEKVFLMNLPEDRIKANESVLKGKKLVISARKQDRYEHPERDSKIVRGTPRLVTDVFDGVLALRAECQSVFVDLKEGDIIEGHLLLIPEDIDLKSAETIAEMLDGGAELLQSVGEGVGPLPVSSK